MCILKNNAIKYLSNKTVKYVYSHTLILFVKYLSNKTVKYLSKIVRKFTCDQNCKITY